MTAKGQQLTPTSPIVRRYLAFQEQKNLAATYMKNTAGVLRRLERDLDVPLEEATEEHLTAWYAAITVSLSAEARAVYLAMVAAFYRWLILDRVRADDPTIRLPRPKSKRGMPRPISDESLRRALAQAHPDVRAIITLAAYAGLRAAEIAGLHGEDVQRDAVPPVLIVRSGKGGKQRVVPLHPLVVDELALLPVSGPLFPRRNDGRPASSNTISSRVGRYLRSIGVSESLHQCRHAFATAVYRESLDLRLTQELLGHSSPNTTARYAAWAPARAAAVVNALPGIEERAR